MLKVQLLHKDAKAPTVAHKGLGFDLYALEDVDLVYSPTTIRTGIAVECTMGNYELGFFIKDRSSMAAKGLQTSGGVIDPDYRGEILVLLSDTKNRALPYKINKGDRIAQLVPIDWNTYGEIEVVKELTQTQRGSDGFGSTGS